MNKNEFKKRLDDLDIKHSSTIKIPHKNDLKYIFVGDNPGKNEFKAKENFIGPAGCNLRKIITEILKIESNKIEMHVAFLNKSMIHTNTTKELIPIKNTHSDVFKESLVICANEIKQLAEPNTKIILLGVNKIFRDFWEEFKDFENIYSFHHPSRGMLRKQLNRECIYNESKFFEFGKSQFKANFRKICR